MLLLYAVAIGLLAGLSDARHARRTWAPSRSASGRSRCSAWLFQMLLFSSPLAAVVGQLGPSLYVVSTTLVLMALIFNLRQPGFWLIILGAFANFAVIVANGGQMPASPEAFAALNGAPVVPTSDFSNSVIAGPGTPLCFLGDIFVLPRPLPFANVFSIGDVLIGIGGAMFIVAVMHRQPVAEGRARAAPPIERPASSVSREMAEA